MEFHFNCVHCAQPILLSTDHLGLMISCPHCRSSFCVPDQIDNEQTIFQPFTDDEFIHSISHFSVDLITQIQQVEKNAFCWPSSVFALMVNHVLNNHLICQTYGSSGGSLFASSNKAKENIIAKQFEYFEILGRLMRAVDESFRFAVDNHDIYLMCKFTELLRAYLIELDQFFRSLETLDYPAKEPYEYLVDRMISWKDELCFSVKTIVAALHNRARFTPEQASLSTVQVSLTPLSIYEFNDVLFT